MCSSDLSNLILSHLFLFLGRLNFIFGGALFAVVFFRHLPALDGQADVRLMAVRGLLLTGALSSYNLRNPRTIINHWAFD